MDFLYKTCCLLAIVAAFALISCGGKTNAPAPSGPPPPVEVDAIIIKEDTFSYKTEAGGTILANEFVELKTEINGRIVELNLQEGTQIQQGTLLVKLFDDDLKATLRKSQAQLDIAKKNVERLKKLLDINGLNQQEYDVALNQVIALESDIAFTNAQIRKTEVRAPFSGWVGLRNVSPGAFVTSQQVLATLQETNALKVDFTLPEAQAGELKKGDVVSVTDGNGKVLQAHVIAIEPQVNTGSRNVKFRARLDDNNSGLNPGAFVSVQLYRGKSSKAILIPTNALIMESRNKKVALIKNGKVKFQMVETGYRGEEKAEIISGLAAGDTLATTGLLFLKPDAAVQFRSIQ